jgi:hypothetical protein
VWRFGEIIWIKVIKQWIGDFWREISKNIRVRGEIKYLNYWEWDKVEVWLHLKSERWGLK